jgi:hypothetical protein
MKKTVDPKIFSKIAVWDWALQKWKGTIIRSHGCNYYDLSQVRKSSSKDHLGRDDLIEPIYHGLKGDLNPIKDALGRQHPLKYGDLIQIGCSKNRGLFIVGETKLFPITQILGGNGYGEIPLDFLFENSGKLPTTYWTIDGHDIISHIPVQLGVLRNNQTGQAYTLTEGSDLCNHKYFYLDLENREMFSLPDTILGRFRSEIQNIENQYLFKNGIDSITAPKKKVLVSAK